MLLPGAAGSVGGIAGTVTKLSDGSGLQGAVVTVAAPDQAPLTATTAADGTYSITPSGDGPFSVGVQASGYAGQAKAGVAGGSPADFSLGPTIYKPLPVYAGSAHRVAADARSGIFYLSLRGAPEVYRTTDYGGSWQTVTAAYDDPETGLRNFIGGSELAASSVSGEVAIENGGYDEVLFSSDYGLTWRKVGGDLDTSGVNPDGYHLHLFWAHAAPGAPNVMVLAAQLDDGSWRVWRADMSAEHPAFTREASDPFGTDSVVTVTSSASGSFIARVNAAGELSFAPLTATRDITFASAEVTGLPTPAQLLRLGGHKEAAAPPDGLLEVGGSTGTLQAKMVTKDAGADSFAGGSASAATAISDDCGGGGTVTPTTTGTSGAGNAGGCWLEKSGTGSALTHPGDIAEGSDIAYDASYGNGNVVAINGQVALGPRKFAQLDVNGVPLSEDDIATAGTDPDSGGFSITGIRAAGVGDAAYGTTASQLAVASAHVIMASVDGGQTMTEILPRSGLLSPSVTWWQGASGEWLVFGHGFDCAKKMLSALLDWNGSSTLAVPNVDGSACTDLGGPPTNWSGGEYVVGALAPVPGTDTLFLGPGVWGEDTLRVGNHVYRARLVPGNPPSLTDVTNFDSFPATTRYMANAMAYCPASSAYAGIRDVLFVATGFNGAGLSNQRGALLRIAGAAGDSPSVTVVESVPHDDAATTLADVRADCASGTVYAGGEDNGTRPAKLYKSTDGGQTFSALATPAGQITAIGLKAGDPNDVTIAFDQGSQAHSSDGGLTWTIVYDANVLRPSGVSDIEFPPPPSGDQTATATSSEEALVGTGAGAFLADVSASRGIFTAGESSVPLKQLTALASDDHPALAPHASGAGSTLVFHRSNGLYWSDQNRGNWALPLRIPDTQRGDSFPALAREADGTLALAFARSGRGIYSAKQAANGSWSSPEQVSSGASDTLPAIAATPSRLNIVFVRPAGIEGLYYASKSSGSWSSPSQIAGTGVNDTLPNRGGPALAADGQGTLHLAFARANSTPGVYLATKASSGNWATPQRLTSGGTDREPAIAVEASGQNHIVFSRPLASGALLETQGMSTFITRQVPGTHGTDAQPALSLEGATLALAFARTSGADPGIYSDTHPLAGSWASSPTRRSGSALDEQPANAQDSQGGVQLAYKRETSIAPGDKTLAVELAGTGGGTITSTPAGIECGAICAHDFSDGTSVTLSANPNPHSTFSGWSGACQGRAACTLTMSSNRSVTATFESDKTLIVTNVGSGAGSVRSTPAGIDCSSICSHAFTHGTVVTLTATAAAGSTFASWSGDCSGTASTCTLTMSRDHSTTTRFKLKKCLVPNVKGRRLTAAKKAIRKAKCRVGKIRRAHSAKVRKGRVISQRPAPRTRVRAGTRVKLVLSTGRRRHH